MACILIVDDEPGIILVLEELFILEGHEVFTASDGESALNSLAEIPKPDIIMVDLYMPKVTGHMVVKAIRADENFKNIPIILLTGAVYNEEEFPPEGSYQFLITKPFNLTEVIEKVELLLESKHSLNLAGSSI